MFFFCFLESDTQHVYKYKDTRGRSTHPDLVQNRRKQRKFEVCICMVDCLILGGAKDYRTVAVFVFLQRHYLALSNQPCFVIHERTEQI
jgi:hypothetical protein